MCIHPRTGPNGERLTCRKCWQCLENFKDQWAGKCIAESRTAAKTYLVTLTYGSDERMGSEGNDIRAVTLAYPDVQLWLKRLRFYSTGRLRFLAAGEYGDAKGRAHWHVIIFCEDAGTVIPNLKLKWRYVHETETGAMLWPHGWSYWEELEAAAQIGYTCKYIKKDDEEAIYNTHVSKRPPLGTSYFTLCAKLHVDQGLSPQDSYYGFPDVLKTHGREQGMPRRYVMSRASAYKYCADFITLWRARYGTKPWPQSDMLDEYLDEMKKRERVTKETEPQAVKELVQRFRAEAKERNVFSWMVQHDAEGNERPHETTPLYLPFPVISDRYLQQSRGT